MKAKVEFLIRYIDDGIIKRLAWSTSERCHESFICLMAREGSCGYETSSEKSKNATNFQSVDGARFDLQIDDREMRNYLEP